MAESNHTALGKGLKLYTDAMRHLAKQRLIAAYPNSWWESGVMGALTDAQRASVKRNMERDTSKDRLEHIDATHLVRIITKEFDHAFHGVFTEGGFSDFKKTQSWLQQVAVARNEWAHPRTGDVLPDDAAQALYAMGQLLSAAKQPEAATIERIRRDILGIDPAAATQPQQPPVPARIEPARSGKLPYWWQVCEPHDAFKNPATIDESLFAATLGGVHAGAARAEYLDPDIFFSHTYFTDNLKQMIRDVASRLAGGEGSAVTEIQTPFGGGKTHALLTLYHLLKDPKRVLALPTVKDALPDISIPPGAKVLVFDGQELSTEPVDKEDGSVVLTLWGELAYQASPELYHRLILQVDSRGEAPGNALFRQVLAAAAPCLILLDELVSYLVKLKFAPSQRGKNLYRQTIQFLQELLQEAGNNNGVCVLISLPKSMIEFGGLDPQELQQQLGVADEVQARSNRVVSKRTPVNDVEIYTLVSRRLFKTTDEGVAQQAARLYRDTYDRTRALYDPTVFSAEYLAAQVAAYPLHPELVDVLYKKWSTASDFPRTRAVLQLLASVVADQWVNRRDAFTIQSADVNLERERVRTRIVSAAGAGGGYDAVVAADIIGGDAHADMLDQRRGGDYERHHVGRGIATTLLMHSFGGTRRMGALLTELRLGTVAPNVGPEYVSEILESLEQTLWYVHREGERLRFQTRANIYRVIAQGADGQPAATVAERLRESLGTAIGSAEGLRVLERAGVDGTVADRPDATIAVLDPRYGVSQEEGGPLQGRERVDQLWEKSGGGLRQWRNALVLVAPDADLWRRAEEAMREVMAYESVIAEAEKGRLEASQLELKDLRSRFNDKKESLRTSITTAFRWAFYPDGDGLTVLPLPVPATKDERIVNRAVARLSDQDYGQPKILTKVGAIYFNSKIAPRLWKDDSTSPLDLGEASRRFPQWTFLPILPDREGTLRACIREGLSDHLWAVAIGDNSSLTYQKLVETVEDLDSGLSLFDGSASLVKGELLKMIREELRQRDGGAVVSAPGPSGPTPGPAGGPGGPVEPPVVEPSGIPTPKRHARVRLSLAKLGVGKTSNLQPYLFKVLQEQDAGAELSISIEVTSSAGISDDVLEKRIVEAFDQLGIEVTWDVSS